MSLQYTKPGFHSTDTAVITIACTTFLTFLIVNRIGSIWAFYPNVLLAIGWFWYLLSRNTDEDTAKTVCPSDGTLTQDTVSLQSAVPTPGEKSILSRCLLFGATMTGLYLPMDRLFSRKAHIIFYLRSEVERLGVPLGLIFTWVIFATFMGYCYHRSLMIFRYRPVAAVLTGAAGCIAATLIYQLGESQLWIWNIQRVGKFAHIAAVPLFVPIAFFFTFLLCPYYFHRAQHAVIAGIRCGIFMGAFQFLSFLLFLYFLK